ncbi:MAG TPA: dihydroorotase [Nitrospirota bacterium]|nr:dihydroorotase [Nitrospirota bacterium]
MPILIKNGRIIDPARGLDEARDIYIEGERISEVPKNGGSGKGVEVIDAAGKLVVPGLIDMHCHLREPGFEYKENIASGTRAAAAGGFTTVCCMPNTSPVNDNRSVTEFILKQAESAGYCRVIPVGAVTKGSAGAELAEIGDMAGAGCRAFSDDGKPVTNAEMMRRALEYAKTFGVTIISHCEDTALSAGGVMNEGPVSTRLGLRGIPAAAEEVMVARDIALARLTGGRLHIAHVSTEGSVRLVRQAKAEGLNVTAETCPHYFTLTDEAVLAYNTNLKVNPPLRTERDREAITEGLADGTIDVIATDHAPHAASEKEVEFDLAPFGISGFETALALSLRLSKPGRLSLIELIAKLTVNPAKALGLAVPSLAPGSPADVTIIDPAAAWTVDPMKFLSRGRNTAFAGMEMRGAAAETVVGGRRIAAR